MAGDPPPGDNTAKAVSFGGHSPVHVGGAQPTLDRGTSGAAFGSTSLRTAAHNASLHAPAALAPGQPIVVEKVVAFGVTSMRAHKVESKLAALGMADKEQHTAHPSKHVQVVCRFRPRRSDINGHEEPSSPSEPPNWLELTRQQHVVIHEFGKDMIFQFDQVHGGGASQGEVFGTVSHVVDGILHGYNGSLLAYGQTSSGKTHTMEGKLNEADGAGVMLRAFDQILKAVSEAPANDKFVVKVSYVEIYCEKLQDLLGAGRDNLKMVEMPGLGVTILDVTEVVVSSKEDVMCVLREGKKSRATSATKMNAGSSRSHAVLITTVTRTNATTGTSLRAKLMLVDLAGSERANKTRITGGQQMKEAKNINKSLTFLGTVIKALADNAQHVPFRDSKLTRLLQESLGGNSRTSIIICCAPEMIHAPETVSTLRFGQRARMITTKAVLNQDMGVAELRVMLLKAQREIERLRAELCALQEGGGLSVKDSLASSSLLVGVGGSLAVTSVAAVTSSASLLLADAGVGVSEAGTGAGAGAGASASVRPSISKTFLVLPGAYTDDDEDGGGDGDYPVDEEELAVKREVRDALEKSLRLTGRTLPPEDDDDDMEELEDEEKEKALDMGEGEGEGEGVLRTTADQDGVGVRRDLLYTVVVPTADDNGPNGSRNGNDDVGSLQRTAKLLETLEEEVSRVSLLLNTRQAAADELDSNRQQLEEVRRRCAELEEALALAHAHFPPPVNGQQQQEEGEDNVGVNRNNTGPGVGVEHLLGERINAIIRRREEGMQMRVEDLDGREARLKDRQLPATSTANTTSTASGTTDTRTAEAVESDPRWRSKDEEIRALRGSLGQLNQQLQQAREEVKALKARARNDHSDKDKGTTDQGNHNEAVRGNGNGNGNGRRRSWVNTVCCCMGTQQEDQD